MALARHPVEEGGHGSDGAGRDGGVSTPETGRERGATRRALGGDLLRFTWRARQSAGPRRDRALLCPRQLQNAVRPISAMPLVEASVDHMLTRAGDGAFVIGADGRIVLWNRSAEKVLGYPAREVVGRPCCDVLAGRDANDNRLCYQGCHVMKLVRMAE